MIPITTGPDIAGKTKFVTGKKLKRESPVYHNKTKSLKHEKCFNVLSTFFENTFNELKKKCIDKN
jgi:hypothetical protein